MLPMDGMISKRHTSGFTLTELIITMAIAAILLAIGIPSFKYVTVSNRISTEVNGLLGDMQFARSEAVKEGLPVTVCASSNATSANPTCSNGTAWQNGWIVFLDSNNNQTVDPGEQVVRTQRQFTSTDTFLPDNGAFSSITFNREGYATTNAVVVVTLQLHDSTSATQWTRCLAITPVGMLTTQKAGVGNCS
jgi:type IV fimbrial biogenesis protein FimT